MKREPDTRPEHVDVLIVGAGLSGIGAACHLQEGCPSRTFAIFEARNAIGGTWDLFRYPGIRSDSDMFTFGYRRRPWREAEAIAGGESIRRYIRDTAREFGVERRIRFQHRVVRAEWSSAAARWTVEARRGDAGEVVRITCSFLFVCSGYFRYDRGHSPRFEGSERFAGQIVHPQSWPEGLDYAGRRIVVIGSGATAVTIVPALARRAAHVTMLQRSPSYILSLPGRDPIADVLGRHLPAGAALALMRWKNALLMTLTFELSQRAPTLMKALIRRGAKRRLPPGYDLDRHFKPRYEPWDQRLCVVPNGDLFKAIREGRASVVTDRIASFTPRGLALASGAELEADLVVTATGLELLVLGGISFVVDGRRVEPSDTVAYKGAMLSGVPNLALALGYTNASWTLKCDLVGDYVVRLLNHMERHGLRQCTPRAPDPALPTRPLIELQAGYVLRALDRLPRQATKAPWRQQQWYPRDVLLLRYGPLADEALEFAGTAPA